MSIPLKTRILLADDHPMVCRGLRMVLDAEPDLTVVAEAGDGREAVRIALSTEVDLAVLDVAMPGMTGLQAAVDVAQRDEHLGGTRVAHDVGQALLGDPVDHELDFVAHRVLELELALDVEVVVGRGRGAQRAQRALQAEVVEHLGAQLASDAAHVVEAAAHGFAGGRELRRVVLAGAAGRVLELEDDAGEDLADLVVELARDPLALGLLREERFAPALAALVLEPVQHVVEGRGQRGDVGVGAADREPAAGLQRLHGAHRRRQPAQRRDEPAQEQHVEDHGDDEAGDQDHGLRAGHRKADLDGREEQQQRGDRQHGRVGEQDTQEQGHRVQACRMGVAPPQDRCPPPWARSPHSATMAPWPTRSP